MIKKKVGKKWGKIKLLETSAVGIPAYDYAINKSFKSLIKALRETAEPIKGELNLEKSPMEEEEATETPVEEATESTDEVSEPEEATAEAEPTAETAETPEEAPAEPEEVKGMSKEDMMEVMTKGFQAALKASATPRGLIESEDSKVDKMKEVLAKKSIGEMAMMNGLFKAPSMYGDLK